VNETGGSCRGLPEVLTGVLGGLKLERRSLGFVGGVFVLGLSGVFGARKLLLRGPVGTVLDGAKKLVGR
jgi:hypothetical protein